MSFGLSIESILIKKLFKDRNFLTRHTFGSLLMHLLENHCIIIVLIRGIL
jgi:hypothetical protein